MAGQHATGLVIYKSTSTVNVKGEIIGTKGWEQQCGWELCKPKGSVRSRCHWPVTMAAVVQNAGVSWCSTTVQGNSYHESILGVACGGHTCVPACERGVATTMHWNCSWEQLMKPRVPFKSPGFSRTKSRKRHISEFWSYGKEAFSPNTRVY